MSGLWTVLAHITTATGLPIVHNLQTAAPFASTGASAHAYIQSPTLPPTNARLPGLNSARAALSSPRYQACPTGPIKEAP